MKTKIILLSLIFTIINFSGFADEMDCSQFKKFSAKYIECNANKLKSKTNKKFKFTSIIFTTSFFIIVTINLSKYRIRHY